MSNKSYSKLVDKRQKFIYGVLSPLSVKMNVAASKLLEEPLLDNLIDYCFTKDSYMEAMEQYDNLTKALKD